MRLLVALVVAAVAFAQSGREGVISGTVRNAATGARIAGARVSANRMGADSAMSIGTTALTDADGGYSLRGLSTGEYRVFIIADSYAAAPEKTVRLGERLAAKDVDFDLIQFGSVTGTVMDADQKPVAGVPVCFVNRNYAAGGLRHSVAACATSSEAGRYTLTGIQPGRSFLLWARRTIRRGGTESSVPPDRDQRPLVPLNVFYPGSTTVSAAEVLTLRPGDARERVDFPLLTAPNLCAEGEVRVPGSAALWLSIAQPELSAPSITVREPITPSRRFRVCNLQPGDYRFTITTGDRPPFEMIGTANVTLSDKDVSGVMIQPAAKLQVPGEVVWDQPEPAPKQAPYLNVVANAIDRDNAESPSLESVAIPGSFQLKNLRDAEYELRISGIPPDLYLKDVTYGDRSIRYTSLHPGSAPAPAGLRIVLARDGGSLAVTVSDADGKPVPDASLALVPAGASTPAAFAASLSFAQSGLDGVWTWKALAPGKYRVMATQDRLDLGFDSVEALWHRYGSATEVEVGPKAKLQMKLRL